MFYEKITELSAKKGMSVARMAQELGLSNATATKWGHGAYTLRLSAYHRNHVFCSARSAHADRGDAPYQP